jgi:hypothetical protein
MMCRITRISVAISFFVLFVAVPSVQALWTDGGIPVCTGMGPQYSQAMISDGAGGTIITWYDIRGLNYDIYAQRLDASGAAMWDAAGVPVCTATGTQHDPKITSDGAGGAIIVWQDSRSGSDIYAQRIDGSGAVQWASDGLPVCSEAHDQRDPLIVPDGTGGAIVVWIDERSSYFDLFAQRIDGSGTILWQTGGQIIRSEVFDAHDPQITPDCAGGAIIAWYDERDGDYDIYAQRINGEGDIHWTANGVPVCTAPFSQYNCDVTHDGACGAIISWYDDSGMFGDVYAQRLDYSGSAQWTAGGIVVCTYANSKDNPRIVSDGEGGAIVTWTDYRSGNSDIYGQRLGPLGTLEWGADGLPVCSAPGNQYYHKMVSDGDGGALITVEDYSGGPGYGILAQRVDGSGAPVWTANGVTLCTAPDTQEDPIIIGDAAGGAIVAWNDSRGGYVKIYAQQIDSKGRPGQIAPVIHTARDVPGDEGGYVTVAWDASPLDYHMGEITEYTLWRAIEAVSALAMIRYGKAIVVEQAEMAPPARSHDAAAVLLKDAMLGKSYYWELAASQDAYGFEEYSKIVPTMFDSTAVSDHFHYFQVVAHTSDPMVFYVSEPDSGYSVDNFTPGAPLGLAGEQLYSPEGLRLTWSANLESDLAGYNIYRGVEPGFEPGTGNLLDSTGDTLLFDGGWRWDMGYWYKVAAVDIHGNESPFAVAGPDAVTGDEPLPDASFLAQNYPNPFNPVTTIAFGLGKTGHVSLRIYDAAGRLVRVLIDKPRSAGFYSVEWNGLSDDGTASASGVYFYLLETDDFKETKKMVLLR